MVTIIEALENVLGVAPDAELEYFGALVILCLTVSFALRFIFNWNKN